MLIIVSYICAVIIAEPIKEFSYYVTEGIPLIGFTMAAFWLSLFCATRYKVSWVYAGARECAYVILGCIVGAAISMAGGMLLFGSQPIYPKMNFAANVLSCMTICSMRFAIRFFNKIILLFKSRGGKNTLVIGAGRLAVHLLRDITENDKLNNNVIGLIDDDPNKLGTIVQGVRVLGTRDDIERICAEKEVEEIIFAIYTVEQSQKAELLDICSKVGCKVKVLYGFEAALNGELKYGGIREVEIEDLLERDPIKLDNALIENDIKGKVVLVTGGGGSIGSELCRQIIKYKPERLIILDIYENTTYVLQQELEENYPEQKLDVLIASVRDLQRLEAIFKKYRPDIVFHAAAHKHVPLMEFSPGEAIKNNVFGTYNTAYCANKFNVKRFVLISTDKAVNPTNVMGASKRMCEMIIQSFAKLGKTEFAAVRFGNVLGSNGSVIPRFKKQIRDGGPLTVTHREITRFFMTIPEAAQLVLQAAAYAKGGEIFVLDMGKPVKIYDLATKLIRLSGYKPDVDIKIEVTGLRAGEKLYEELLMNEEGLQKTAHSKIFIGQPIDLTPEELSEKLELLKNAMTGDIEDVKRAMKIAVPTYHEPPTEEPKEAKITA